MTPRDQIRQMLEQEDCFLIACHANPDGDALGAAAALGFIARAMGKQVMLYNISGVPDHLSWLELPAPLVGSLAKVREQGFHPSRIFILDSGELHRAGDELAEEDLHDLLVNIDHHMDNPGFGAVNWVDTTMSSVGEMIALLALDLNIPMQGPLGEALYLAIVSDTGNFSYGNTRPSTHELAARLLREGLDPGSFITKYENQWTLNRLQLWSEVLGRATLYCSGQVGLLRIPAETLRLTGTTIHDCEGLVNYVRRVKSVRVAVVLREDGPEAVKISLRSFGDDNVQAVAAKLDGGGHRNAAGCNIRASMDEAEDLLLETIRTTMALSGEWDTNPERIDI